MSGNGTERTELIEVIATDGNLRRGEGTLHRLDDDAGCNYRPDTNTSTDLVTAAVADGHTLCSRCEWPDDAEEVLHS